MIHISFRHLPDKAKALAGGEDRNAVCGTDDDTPLTETALASDCDACRIRLNIGGKNDLGGDRKRVGVKPVPVFEPGECLGPGREKE